MFIIETKIFGEGWVSYENHSSPISALESLAWLRSIARYPDDFRIVFLGPCESYYN